MGVEQGNDSPQRLSFNIPAVLSLRMSRGTSQGHQSISCKSGDVGRAERRAPSSPVPRFRRNRKSMTVQSSSRHHMGLSMKLGHQVAVVTLDKSLDCPGPPSLSLQMKGTDQLVQRLLAKILVLLDCDSGRWHQQ